MLTNHKSVVTRQISLAVMDTANLVDMEYRLQSQLQNGNAHRTLTLKLPLGYLKSLNNTFTYEENIHLVSTVGRNTSIYQGKILMIQPDVQAYLQKQLSLVENFNTLKVEIPTSLARITGVVQSKKNTIERCELAGRYLASKETACYLRTDDQDCYFKAIGFEYDTFKHLPDNISIV